MTEAMFTKKRNFTLLERKLLLQILKSFKIVTENKKSDADSAAAKRIAWKKISERYNCSPLVNKPASDEQLRRLWQNIKSRHRSLIRESYRMATGSSKPCPNTDPNIQDTTRQLLGEIPAVIDSEQNVKCDPSSSEDPLAGATTLADITANMQSYISTTSTPHSENEIEHIAEVVLSSKKKLRTPIFRKRYTMVEQHAIELHNLTLRHMEEKHHLECEILCAKLREAIAKAQKAESDILT